MGGFFQHAEKIRLGPPFRISKGPGGIALAPRKFGATFALSI
jgi:hypothetical protein